MYQFYKSLSVAECVCVRCVCEINECLYLIHCYLKLALSCAGLDNSYNIPKMKLFTKLKMRKYSFYSSDIRTVCFLNKWWQKLNILFVIIYILSICFKKIHLKKKHILDGRELGVVFNYLFLYFLWNILPNGYSWTPVH